MKVSVFACNGVGIPEVSLVNLAHVLSSPKLRAGRSGKTLCPQLPTHSTQPREPFSTLAERLLGQSSSNKDVA